MQKAKRAHRHLVRGAYIRSCIFERGCLHIPGHLWVSPVSWAPTLLRHILQVAKFRRSTVFPDVALSSLGACVRTCAYFLRMLTDLSVRMRALAYACERTCMSAFACPCVHLYRGCAGLYVTFHCEVERCLVVFVHTIEVLHGAADTIYHW